MDNCIGLISTDTNDDDFGAITKYRPAYMVPMGGRYRLIDFPISNMVNHGLQTIAIYTGPKIRSVMDHLGNGKAWDLNRRFSGLFMFPPSNEGVGTILPGSISDYYSTINFFNRIREDYILLVEPSILAKVDLNEVYRYFLDSGKDITLVYKRMSDPTRRLINSTKLYLDKQGNLKKIGINLGTEEEFDYFIGMAFLKKEVFLEIIKNSVEKGNARDFMQALTLNSADYEINSCEFKGHVETIRNLQDYYEANMSLLKKEISRSVFLEGGPVITKTKDEPSTLYGENSNVENSLVANGCIIEGEVENSIIFRGVRIGKNSIVKNSIIMQKSEIRDEAIVVNSILDKYTVIDDNVRIVGSPGLPYVVEKYSNISNKERGLI